MNFLRKTSRTTSLIKNVNSSKLNELIKCCKTYEQDKYETKSAIYIFGELFLIILVIALWLVSIAVCMNKYSKLRRLQPSHKSNKYDSYHTKPKNIEEIQVVKHEHESIIYRKIRPSGRRKTLAVTKILEVEDSNCEMKNELKMDAANVKETEKGRRIMSLSDSELNDKKKYSQSTPDCCQINPNMLRAGKYKSVLNNEDENFVYKRISTKEKRNFFASSNKRKNFKELRKDKRAYLTNNFQRYHSQDRYRSRSLKDSPSPIMNPSWIPLDVQRVFLDLHMKSKANVSKSESTLNRHNCRDSNLQ